ncbi:hypothetical protein [Psychromonas aquimarina]|uniref:hypothetical protein n=1 Tax=Psychromonas aquimarina TaxID=444919 RepID=UPI000423D059|nr:hypothetical protein [Psychromonas aquimarina]
MNIEKKVNNLSINATANIGVPAPEAAQKNHLTDVGSVLLQADFEVSSLELPAADLIHAAKAALCFLNSLIHYTAAPRPVPLVNYYSADSAVPS